MPHDPYQPQSSLGSTIPRVAKSALPIAAAALLALAACGGGGGSAAPITPGGPASPIGTVSPTPVGGANSPSPAASPSPGATASPKPTTSPGTPTAAPSPTTSPVSGISVSPSSLSFTAVGSPYALPVALSQPGGTGFAVSTCVSGGVTIASAPATTTGTLPVTPQSAGTCTFTVTGVGGQTAAIQVTVTTTSIGSQ